MSSKPLPLTLDASALLKDPLWARLEPDGRGILVSLWVACQIHGSIPADPVAAARLAMMDADPVVAWWDTLRSWFTAHPTQADALIAPHLLAGTVAALRRREHASAAARSRHRGGRPPTPPLPSLSAAEAAARLAPLASAVSKMEEKVAPSARAVLGQPDSGDSTCSGSARAMLGHEPLESAGLSLEDDPAGLASLVAKSLQTTPELSSPGNPALLAAPLLSPPTPPSLIPSVPSRNLSLSGDVENYPRRAHDEPPDPAVKAWRDLFRPAPDALPWFLKVRDLRSDFVERMDGRLRSQKGVAGPSVAKGARNFLARVAAGHDPRLLAGCFYLYLKHDDQVARGFVQSLETFYGDPKAPGAKATWLSWWDRAVAAKNTPATPPAAPAPPPAAAVLGVLAAAGLAPPPVAN